MRYYAAVKVAAIKRSQAGANFDLPQAGMNLTGGSAVIRLLNKIAG